MPPSPPSPPSRSGVRSLLVIVAVSVLLAGAALWLLERRRMRRLDDGGWQRLRVYTSITSPDFLPQLKVLLRSARPHRDLEHIVLVQSEWQPPELMALMRETQAKVVEHQALWALQIKEALARLRLNTTNDSLTQMGLMARFDVPLLHASALLERPLSWIVDNAVEAAKAIRARPLLLDRVTLYVDADTFWMHSMARHILSGKVRVPSLWAASSESDVRNYDHFNAGVMLFNVPEYLEAYAGMLASLTSNKFACLRVALDQGCLQFLSRERDVMDEPDSKLAPQWNWKPYLHHPQDTVPPGEPIGLVHFHGVKPAFALKRFLDSAQGKTPEPASTTYALRMTNILMRNPAGYAHWLTKWLEFHLMEDEWEPRPYAPANVTAVATGNHTALAAK